MAKSLEGQIQTQVMDWVRNNEENHEQLKVIFHTPNSFFGTGFGVIQWLKKLGMRKGVYDIIVPISKQGYSALWIEIKKEKGKLTTEQKMFQELINKYSDTSTKFEIFTDANQCIKCIQDYLSI
jgi:predicted double-glycine peptidase